MKYRFIHLSQATFCACLLFASLVAAVQADDDDDDKAPPGQPGALPALTVQQQQAVGVVVARAPKTTTPEHMPALGLVLDPSAIVADLGEIDSARASERAANAEVERLRGLLHAGAGAAQKNLDAAQADAARTHAQAETASAHFNARWGALAKLSATEKQKTITAATSGKDLLLRADLPGRHSLGIVPSGAVLDVDGIDVPGRVLGLLAQGATDAQGVGVLVEVDDPLPGLSPGARVPLVLVGASRSGFLVPRGALIFEEGGAFLYKQLGKKTADGKNQYAQVKVKLLAARGDGWLVDGIDDDDDIVVRGSGVLWSLQGLAGKSAADDDDD